MELRTCKAALAVIQVLLERQRVGQVDRRLRCTVSASQRDVACAMSRVSHPHVHVAGGQRRGQCTCADSRLRTAETCAAERQQGTPRRLCDLHPRRYAAHQVAGPQRDALLQRNDAANLVKEEDAAASEGEERP